MHIQSHFSLDVCDHCCKISDTEPHPRARVLEHYCKRSVWVMAHWVSNTKACTKRLLLHSSWAAGSLCGAQPCFTEEVTWRDTHGSERELGHLLECSKLAIKLQGLKSNTEAQVYFKSEWVSERAVRGQDLGPCSVTHLDVPGSLVRLIGNLFLHAGQLLF